MSDEVTGIRQGLPRAQGKSFLPQRAVLECQHHDKKRRNCQGGYGEETATADRHAPPSTAQKNFSANTRKSALSPPLLVKVKSQVSALTTRQQPCLRTAEQARPDAG